MTTTSEQSFGTFNRLDILVLDTVWTRFNRIRDMTGVSFTQHFQQAVEYYTYIKNVTDHGGSVAFMSETGKEEIDPTADFALPEPRNVIQLAINVNDQTANQLPGLYEGNIAEFQNRTNQLISLYCDMYDRVELSDERMLIMYPDGTTDQFKMAI